MELSPQAEAEQSGLCGLERPQAVGAPAKPSLSFVGRGGARERVELSPQAEAERSGLCDDEGAYWFRRGRRSRNSERMRLTSLKRAPYKSKNNDNVVLAAA